jgi:predicted Zn-dependent peptidase
MKGYEQNLTAACQLLAKQVLMPKLDLKQLDNIKGNTLSERQIQQETVNSLSAALNEYQKYGDKSDYIDRLTDKEALNLGISELTGDINRASGYGADIFYTGTLPFNNVYDILSHNLPLVANEKASDSPQDKPYAQVKENTVYFLPNQDAEQTKIYFFIPSANFDKEDLVKIGAFNYGFYTLAFNELREKRSMVYTTDGRIKTPKLKGDQMAFEGFLGTQNDKAMDALKLFNGLIQNMSIKSDRIDDIKSFLKEASMSQYPDFRDKAQTIEYYKQQGFTQDPVVEALPRIEALTYNDLVDFYNKNIKGRPYSIAIIGNPKTIDLDQLKQYGKVVKLSNDKLFNSKDKLAY